LQLRNLKAFVGGQKNLLPQKQGYPSYATGNTTSINVTSFSPPFPNVFSGGATGYDQIKLLRNQLDII